MFAAISSPGLCWQSARVLWSVSPIWHTVKLVLKSWQGVCKAAVLCFDQSQIMRFVVFSLGTYYGTAVSKATSVLPGTAPQ